MPLETQGLASGVDRGLRLGMALRDQRNQEARSEFNMEAQQAQRAHQREMDQERLDLRRQQEQRQQEWMDTQQDLTQYKIDEQEDARRRQLVADGLRGAAAGHDLTEDHLAAMDDMGIDPERIVAGDYSRAVQSVDGAVRAMTTQDSSQADQMLQEQTGAFGRAGVEATGQALRGNKRVAQVMNNPDVIDAVEVAAGERLKRGVGDVVVRDGRRLVIDDKRIAGLVPMKGGSVGMDLEITARDADTGETVRYNEPVTERRSGDPDDPAVGVPVTELMDHLQGAATIERAIKENPETKANFESALARVDPQYRKSLAERRNARLTAERERLKAERERAHETRLEAMKVNGEAGGIGGIKDLDPQAAHEYALRKQSESGAEPGSQAYEKAYQDALDEYALRYTRMGVLGSGMRGQINTGSQGDMLLQDYGRNRDGGNAPPPEQSNEPSEPERRSGAIDVDGRGLRFGPPTTLGDIASGAADAVGGWVDNQTARGRANEFRRQVQEGRMTLSSDVIRSALPELDQDERALAQRLLQRMDGDPSPTERR